jgi:hypothetical protein
LALHRDAAGEAVGQPGDGREEGLDQLAARIRITGFSGDHQIPLLSGGQAFGAAH